MLISQACQPVSVSLGLSNRGEKANEFYFLAYRYCYYFL